LPILFPQSVPALYPVSASPRSNLSGQCNQDFGKVKALIIVRPGKEGADAQLLGKVLVEFEDVEFCKKAATVCLLREREV